MENKIHVNVKLFVSEYKFTIQRVQDFNRGLESFEVKAGAGFCPKDNLGLGM
jgi:hypothetical protein